MEDILIRTNLEAGDLGHVVSLHGLLYKEEYNYGIAFENYVAAGLHEFYSNYHTQKDRVWICEYKKEMVGFLLLIHRENNSSQLRHFIIDPRFRGIGLGSKMMNLYLDFFNECGYSSSWLWTTAELTNAAALHTRYGFILTTEKASTAFGKPVIEQQYEFLKNNKIL